MDSIPSVSMVKGTGEAPRSVDTESISVTVVSVVCALINIYNKLVSLKTMTRLA